MSSSRFRAVALLVVASAATGFGFQSSSTNRPWPPEVQKVSDQSPVLSPEEALKTIYMPPGYRLELVASEPLVQEPVAMDWDTDGRLWVVEMPGWMPNITADGEHDPIGRVVVLEDLNRDGRMDKRTVFADGLVLARSVKVLERGVLVGEPPNVWLIRDTNGDLRADAKELVTNQYGHRDVDPQNNANGFHWSLDNRMHTAGQSDIQLRLKDGKFEVQRTLRRGEWGVTHDDAGRIYRNTNESALHVDLVQTAYYARNPNLLRTRGSYERLATGNEDLNIVWPVRPNPGTNRAYQTGIDRPDGTLAKFTAVCAPVVYRGDRLPGELYGNVFVAEPAANLVSRLVVEDDGTTITARKAYERGEYIASTDERFRPVFITNAPDGTLYIADLYRGIIEHRVSITMYLRDQILSRKLEAPTGLGRIYRVVHETTRRDLARPLGGASATQLVEALSHPNGWWRDTAQRVLVEHGNKAVAPALAKLASGAKDSRTRLHALWTLDGLDALEPALIERALDDASRDVRVSAIRIAERWLGEATHPIHTAVLKRIEDSDWWVRQQLAASLGVMPAAIRDTAMATLLERHGDDPVVVDAALSGLRGSEAVVLAKILERVGPTFKSGENGGTNAAITMLAATIVRSAQDAAIHNLFAWIADTRRAEWQRSALLRGAEVALLGAAMPGRPVRQRANTQMPAANAAPLPCPTCPGGRAGPGGAYAFTRPDASPRPRGRGGSSGLRLNREPSELAALAEAGGDLGKRAATVLARVAWPGKPGVETVPPLTAEEQQRYEAGRDVYRNVCQACHQPDGRGQDRIAPSLVESEFALAAPGIPVRILLNGKEGTFGLMPPIGAALNDEQLASVLTYVRREWGQTGAPIDPATVKAVRVQTAGRTRPWTEAELKSLAEGQLQNQATPPAAAGEKPQDVHTPGKVGVTAPRLIKEVKPQYSVEAMRARLQGRVILECVVDAVGGVQSVRVVRPLGEGLDEAAVAAVRQWQFSPATRQGVAVPVLVRVEVSFSLKDQQVLTWPAVFAKGDASIDERGWSEEIADVSDLQVRFSYPAGWEIHRGGLPARLLLAHSADGMRFVDISRPRPSARNIDAPLSVPQLEQSLEMLRKQIALSGNLQIVDSGQFQISNRLWLWHELHLPTFDPLKPPVEMSVPPDGKFDSLRFWSFTTTERSQLVTVICTLMYRRGMSETVMEEQTRRAGAEFAAIIQRLSITPNARAAFVGVLERPRVALDPVLASRTDTDGIVQERLSFASQAGERVPTLLLKQQAGAAKRPAVIVLHGTGGSKDGVAARLKSLAARGFVAVAIDARYHGERAKPAAGPLAPYQDAILKAYRTQQERPFLYDTVWDVMRLIDYLRTRDDIDAARIGLMGISKGGMETYLAAAADPRIAVAVPMIGVQSFRWALEHSAWDSRAWTLRPAVEAAAKETGDAIDARFMRKFYDRVAPGLYSDFDGPAMLPLIAPRPLLVISGDSDPRTPVAGVRLCIAAAERAYNAAGAADRLVLHLQPDAGHEVTPAADRAAIEWFSKWLTPPSSSRH